MPPEHSSSTPCLVQTIALIYETFRGVTREGGVSWSESIARDNWCTDEECAAARLQDTDSRWEELADDLSWEPVIYEGGFNFLDIIGARYYLPAAMVRELKGEPFYETLDFYLTSDRGLPEFLSSFSLEEVQCICEFIKCMVSISPHHSLDAWLKVYIKGWIDIDQNPL